MNEALAYILGRLQEVSDSGDAWVALCPCLGHGDGRGDTNPSLRVAVGETGKVIIRCRAGCSTDDVLDAIGLTYRDLLDAGEGLSPYPAVGFEIPKGYLFWYNLYCQNGLEAGHKDHLIRDRKLSEDRVLKAQFFSVRPGDVDRLCRDFGFPLPHKFPSDLCSGLAIPVYSGLDRSDRDTITGIKVRRFLPGPKYLWVSHQTGSPPPYWPYPPTNPGPNPPLIVVEGELASEYLADQGYDTVAVGGVNNWPRLPDLPLDNGVVLAFDWPDIQTKAGVRDQVIRALEVFRTKGKKVWAWGWDGRAKGPDDAVRAGHQIRTLTLEELRQETEPVLLHATETETGYTGLVNDPDFPDTPPTKTSALSDDLTPPEFPLDVFPSAVREFFEYAVEKTSVPPDFVGLVGLTLLGTALGAARKVEWNGEWREQASFYSCLVAPSGEGKTPAIRALMRPFYQYQDELFKDYRAELDAAPDDKAKAKVPKPKDLYLGDTTQASVGIALDRNRKGLLIQADEILGWVKRFGAHDSSGDQQFFLEAWNGSPLKVNRVGRDLIWVGHPFLSVLGGIQPRRLPELAADGRTDDGFLQRFLYVYPAERPMPYLRKFPVDPALEASWASTVRRLLLGLDVSKYRNVHLDPDADALFTDYYNHKIVDEIRSGLLPEHLVPYWAKLRSYALRIALTLQYADYASTPSLDESKVTVTAGTMLKATELCEYFKAHTRRVTGDLTPNQEKRAIKALKALLSGPVSSGTVLARDIASSGHPGLPDTYSGVVTLFFTAERYGLGKYYRELHGSRDVFVLEAPKVKK